MGIKFSSKADSFQDGKARMRIKQLTTSQNLRPGKVAALLPLLPYFFEENGASPPPVPPGTEVNNSDIEKRRGEKGIWISQRKNSSPQLSWDTQVLVSL